MFSIEMSVVHRYPCEYVRRNLLSDNERTIKCKFYVYQEVTFYLYPLRSILLGTLIYTVSLHSGD